MKSCRLPSSGGGRCWDWPGEKTRSLFSPGRVVCVATRSASQFPPPYSALQQFTCSLRNIDSEVSLRWGKNIRKCPGTLPASSTPMRSATIAAGTATDLPPGSPTSRPIDETLVRSTGLARKLTCSVVTIVFTGVVLILLIQVGLVLASVNNWGGDTKDAMIELEKENIMKLASDKAGFVTEIFGRVEESMLQIQSFAEQILLEEPEMLLVDGHVMSYPGLEQANETWEHSVWFVPGYDVGERAAFNSSVEDLLNRTSLMDVPFRGMQRQHSLIYLAALENPSAALSDPSKINLQAYAGFDMEEAGFHDFSGEEGCDDRFAEYEDSDNSTGFEPRCRLWYQDAKESGGGVIFTNPYVDASTGQLIVTVAAPVFNTSNSTLLLGVAGIDMDISDVEESINSLRVVEDEGYAYLLAPGMQGEVAVHRKLLPLAGTQYIVDLEENVDEVEFGEILTEMDKECSGSEVYWKGDDAWLLSWQHETASSASGGSLGCIGGFIVVVTVAESPLLKVFSETESEIRGIVLAACLAMAAILAAIACCIAWFARTLSESVTEPVNQLVDVVQALNRMDFSRQVVGTWIVNDVTSPEVEELVTAFEAMTTVIKFANTTLGSGDVDVAEQNYIDALVMFKKLGNERGVSIVYNNLGNVYTLQARTLVAKATTQRLDWGVVRELLSTAEHKFDDAATSYQLAIDDAEMLCSEKDQESEETSSLTRKRGDGSTGECKEQEPPERLSEAGSTVGGSLTAIAHADNDLSSSAALELQLYNRKFNLALCLASKVNNAALAAGTLDNDAISTARRLFRECAELAAERKDAKGDQRQFESLLELATLEIELPGRQREASNALEDAERVIMSYRGARESGAWGTMYNRSGGIDTAAPTAPLAVLQQKLFAARGAHLVAEGHLEAAIESWSKALICCGDRMDASALRFALEGLRGQAEKGLAASFPKSLLAALGLKSEDTFRGVDSGALVSAIDSSLARLDTDVDKHGLAMGRRVTSTLTDVDLCFVMDCTGSMGPWINKAKTKLCDIVAQAKKSANIRNLRVAFVGYRDFGESSHMRYEGPYDFHTSDKLSGLLTKLRGIRATGGRDVPEDIAGGLQHACHLTWKSPARLCILIADAPCHGSMYHNLLDNYPGGCPKKLDPTKLIYNLQYQLGVDFYFVRITSQTDQMIDIWQKAVAGHAKSTERPALGDSSNTKPKFVVHDLSSEKNDHFLEAVVESVKTSVRGINLKVEVY